MTRTPLPDADRLVTQNVRLRPRTVRALRALADQRKIPVGVLARQMLEHAVTLAVARKRGAA